MIGLQCFDRGWLARAVELLVSPLRQMFADVAVAAASPLEPRHRGVAPALLPCLDRPDLPGASLGWDVAVPWQDAADQELMVYVALITAAHY